MTGHIRSHRALASALADEADHATVADPNENAAMAGLLRCLAAAHRCAADALEKEELDLLDHIGRIEHPRPAAPE